MKSVMKHDFSRVPQANIPRSVFNRSHAHKTTFNAGYLIPFYVDEALPGDTFNLNATIFARMTTPLYPVMDNLFMDIHYFAVPLRLIWSNFTKFMGETVDPYDPDASVEYLTPVMTVPSGGFVNGTLPDYFGLPVGVGDKQVINSFHFRAYNLIWNEWYRDQSIQDSVVVDTDDGPDSHTDYVLLRRGKRHDYFTSCLPWPQKGPAVQLPLGDSAPVSYASANAGLSDSYILGVYSQGADAWKGLVTKEDGTGGPVVPYTISVGNDYKLKADLSEATSSTINALRQAFQLQRLYERDARGGTRYTELVRSHFGVISPDARLQRPEYLGGSSSRVVMQTVAQTSETTERHALATLGAIGTITGRGGFSKSFTEHCVILGLLSVRADLTYQQGLPRMFSRRSRWDYYWPGLAHLGEQAVYGKEIYAVGDEGEADTDNTVFGYQERWAEYRYYPSKITGQFRSTFSTPLDAWHLSQEFGSRPTLSPTFIVENPPMSRVLAVADAPHFIMDSYIQCRAARPMPVYSVPGLIDHF